MAKRGSLKDVLNTFAREMAKWNRNSFGSVQKRLKSLRQDLEKIRLHERTSEIVEEEGRISYEIDEWCMREELLLETAITSKLAEGRG